MTTTTITVDDLIGRYADDIAYVAGQDAAVDLEGLIGQLGTAAQQYETAGVTGHEDVETAATLLGEASRTEDASARAAFFKRADVLLW